MSVKSTTLPEPSASEKLNQLLELMNIEEVYYVDDLFDYNPLPVILSHAKDLYEKGEIEELITLFGQGVKTDLPDVDIFGNELEKHWRELDQSSQVEIIKKMDLFSFDTKDYDHTLKLQAYFPAGIFKTVSPDDWSRRFTEIEKKYKASQKKVLVLFDQDLTQAKGEKFRSGVTKGTDLILSSRGSNAGKNIVCTLLTHLISEVSKELSERNRIVQKSNGTLSKNDFFALSKKRIRFPEKLCDGIKKALLNGHCEEIKEKATEIIDEAYKEVILKLDRLDTYDFDHIILRSSYGEGVWEVNTLMRIANNLYDQKIRELMVSKKFTKSVNPAIKRAKELSDITFTIPANHQPYREKLILRHHDIYSPGKHINELHLPIENGDVFEVFEGSGKGLYILVSQECDMMMRTSRGGSGGARAAETAILLKIRTFSLQNLKREIESHFKRSGMLMHYYANKFKLEYFKEGKKDVGIVNFNNIVQVDLDALDLTVFNSNGVASINLAIDKFDIDLVSAAWEMRYERLFQLYTSRNNQIKTLAPKLAALDNATKQKVLGAMGCKLAPLKNFGKPNVYSEDKFDFGIRRIMRFKDDGARFLLDRYYRHLSRKAEPHDFVG